jgi:integrator complex subunit 3
MESIRLSCSYSNLGETNTLMGMKTTNNHLGQQQQQQQQNPPNIRMPDPSNNLTLLNQQQQMGPAAATTPTPMGGSRLFFSSQLESRDDLDERHERCYSLIMNSMAGKSDKEAVDALTTLVAKDPRAHEDVCLGLVIAILTNPSVSDGDLSASRCFRDLTLICRDGLSFVLSHLTHLISEKYLKLLPHVKNQLMWLIREMVRSSIVGMDLIVWNLMRQIAGGDVSRGNLWLADSLLEIFIEHRSWLEKYSFLVASVVYTYLRLIEDHVSPPLEKLREKEVKFVVSLIRDRFTDVMTIGRDFVRILQNVARLPEIAEVWRDILSTPRVLSPNFSGLAQLMETRTSRRFLQCRITPEMEKKLVYLTSQVLHCLIKIVSALLKLHL